MPQSHIFGSERPHPFVGQHEFVSNESFLQNFGGQTETKGIGMKRKETWVNNNQGAGNFEMQQNPFGPSSQKRIKTSMNDEGQLQSWHPIQADTSMDTLAQNNTMHQVPNSMVTHMTMSFPPPNKEQALVPEDKSCDMEMDDCTAMTVADSVPEPCLDDNWKGWSDACTFDGPWWDNLVGCCHGS